MTKLGFNRLDQNNDFIHFNVCLVNMFLLILTVNGLVYYQKIVLDPVLKNKSKFILFEYTKVNSFLF